MILFDIYSLVYFSSVLLRFYFIILCAYMAALIVVLFVARVVFYYVLHCLQLGFYVDTDFLNWILWHS